VNGLDDKAKAQLWEAIALCDGVLKVLGEMKDQMALQAEEVQSIRGTLEGLIGQPVQE
jgi:hypothetical protein